MFSWDNLQKTFYHVEINNKWIQVNESEYTVKDVLLYDGIRITVREYEKGSPKDHKLTYNGELDEYFLYHYIYVIIYAFMFV